MTVSWPAFIGGARRARSSSLNFVFALIYDLGDAPIANAREGSLPDLFFFSVETTSTVGYGDMHPQTIYGHIVATVENFRRPAGAGDDDGPRLRAHLASARAAHLRPIPGRRPAQRRADADVPHRQRAQQLHQRGDRQDSGCSGRRESPGGPAAGRLPADAAGQVRESDLRAELDAVPSDRRRTVRSSAWTRRRYPRARSISSSASSASTRPPAQTVHARETFSPRRTCASDHEFVDIICVDEDGLRHIDYARIDETRPVEH